MLIKQWEAAGEEAAGEESEFSSGVLQRGSPELCSPVALPVTQGRELGVGAPQDGGLAVGRRWRSQIPTPHSRELRVLGTRTNQGSRGIPATVWGQQGSPPHFSQFP